MPPADSFTGFDQARQIMSQYEARSHAKDMLIRTAFIKDERIAFVHVDNFSRVDRMTLTAFGGNGVLLGVETVYTNGRSLDLTPEFSHHYTRSAVPVNSDLDQVGEDGWIIAMDALRAYDADADRRETQKTIVVSHLQDMIKDGDARCFLFSESLMAPETSGANQRDNEATGGP